MYFRTARETNKNKLPLGISIKRSWLDNAQRWFLAIFKVKRSLFGGIWIAIMIFSAIFAPEISPFDPYEQNIGNMFASPGFKHWLGTDYLGRDLLARMIYGCRIAMLVSFGSITISSMVGVFLGMLAGYNEGKKIDYVIIFIFDTIRSIPQIVLAIALIAVVGPSLRNLILVMAFSGFPFWGRIARAQALVAKEFDYVKSAVAMGLKRNKIIFRHIMPNILTPIIACLGMELAWMIVYEAGLSFLGLGVIPPTASWGIMLRNGYKYIDISPWMILWPAFAIAMAMLAFSFFSEGLKNALDPKQRER